MKLPTASASLCMFILTVTSGMTLRAEVRPLPEGQRIRVAEGYRFAVPDKDPMQLPTDVAVGRDRSVFVADGVNRRIVIFSADGDRVETIRTVGGRALADPVGLAMDDRSRLWITDIGHAALIVLDRSARQADAGGRWIDLPAGDDGDRADPTDVAVARDGKRIWVADNDHHRLMFRESDDGAPGGGAWTPIGGPGTGLGQFQWPFMLAVGPGGDLYVTEAIGARVQHVTPALRWSGQIGRWGVRPGEFYRPKGVAVDGDERVYVSDSTMGVVQVFHSDGRLVGVLSAEDGRPYRFEHPMGLSFDDRANLYVVEMEHHTVTRITLAVPPATRPAPAQDEEDAE